MYEIICNSTKLLFENNRLYIDGKFYVQSCNDKLEKNDKLVIEKNNIVNIRYIKKYEMKFYNYFLFFAFIVSLIHSIPTISYSISMFNLFEYELFSFSIPYQTEIVWAFCVPMILFGIMYYVAFGWFIEVSTYQNTYYIKCSKNMKDEAIRFIRNITRY